MSGTGEAVPMRGLNGFTSTDHALVCGAVAMMLATTRWPVWDVELDVDEAGDHVPAVLLHQVKGGRRAGYRVVVEELVDEEGAEA